MKFLLNGSIGYWKELWDLEHGAGEFTVCVAQSGPTRLFQERPRGVARYRSGIIDRMAGPETLSDGVIQSAIKGSSADVARIMAAMSPQVRTMIVVRLTPSPSQWHAVDDLVQEVLAGVVQSLPSLRQATVAGLRSFVSSMVSHKTTDFLRGCAKAPEHSLDSTRHFASAVATLKDVLPASGISPHSMLARSESLAHVMRELGNMHHVQREVITLAFFDHLPMAEIADRMGVSRPAASMQLIRAMRELRMAITGSSRVQDGSVGGH